MLKLYLLGTPRIELDGEMINLGRRKAVALLAYLILNPQMYSRDSLASLLWIDYDAKRARADLRNTIYAINKKLGDQWLIVEREMVGVAPDTPIWIDVQAFREAINSCRTHGHHPDEVCIDCLEPLTYAFELYQNDFLAGFTVNDAAEFENWQVVQREYLRMELNRIFEKIVRTHSARQEFETAIAYAQNWLQVDVCNEEAHSYLMSLYTWNGQRSAAINQYQYCEQVLAAELEAEPFEETVDLYHDILDNIIPALPTIYYPQGASARLDAETAPPRHNLQPQPTPFFGRQTELTKIGENLAKSSCRLLSILGLGGMGKTRLAMQAGYDNLAQFADGVFFVGLIGVRNRLEIIQTMAEALNYKVVNPNAPLEPQLLNYLTSKQMLLILDNFEHLLTEKEVINTLLEVSPQSKLLVTSRIPLDLQAEWKFDLAGMLESTMTLAENSAVQLFLEHGQRVLTDFAPTDDDLAIIVDICTKLDGIPLAIELTTSWLRVLSPAEILAELNEDLAFLETHYSDTPERHQSLQATFDYSWQLLSETEQTLFAKLSVFRGGFTREAATTIAGAKLNVLSGLAHKALLKRNAQGRYEIHEMLRQFAALKLDALPAQKQETLNKFGLYYANFLQASEAPLKGSQQFEAEQSIRTEIENIRYGFQWMIHNQQLHLLDQLLHGLGIFHLYQHWFEEGIAQMQQIVDLGEKAIVTATDSSFIYRLMGRALAYQARWHLELGNHDLAKTLAERAENILINTDAHLELGMVYGIKGRDLRYRSLFDDAQAYYEKALVAYQQAEDVWNIAQHYNVLGDLNCDTAFGSGHFTKGKAYYEEGLAMARQIENPTLMGMFLLSLCWLMGLHEGDYDQAIRYGLESIALFEQIGMSSCLADCYRAMGSTYRRINEIDKSLEYFRSAEKIIRDSGNPDYLIAITNNMGLLFLQTRDYTQSQRYFSESVQVAEANQRTNFLPLLYSNLAEILLLNGEYNEAEIILTKSLAYLSSEDTTILHAYHYQLMAKLRLKQHQLVEVEALLRQALTITIEKEGEVEVYPVLLGYADLWHQQGQSELSLTCLQYILNQSNAAVDVREEAQTHFDHYAVELSPEDLAHIETQAQQFSVNGLLAY